MNKTVQDWLDDYGASHQNSINKLIHWICIPFIMLSLIGLLWNLPPNSNINLGIIFITFACLYYLRMSFAMFVGMFCVAGLPIYGVQYLETLPYPLWKTSLIIFSVAWIFQFIGHTIEGKKPSFFKDIQFLLIGPLWLLGFIYRKLGIKY